MVNVTRVAPFQNDSITGRDRSNGYALSQSRLGSFGKLAASSAGERDAPPKAPRH